MQSLRNIPDIVSYPLIPIHELVADSTVRGNVKAIVRQFPKDKAVPKEKPSQQCTNQPNLSSECCLLSPRKGKLCVSINSGWSIGPGLDPIGPPDPYVKMWYWNHFRQTHYIKDTKNPHWNSHYDLGHVEAIHEIVSEVWDKDLNYDDHLGTCCIRLNEGSHSGSCSLKKGGFSYSYTLTCDPYLMGFQCSRYKVSYRGK